MFLVKFINSLPKCYWGELWLRLKAHLGFWHPQGSGSRWGVLGNWSLRWWTHCLLIPTTEGPGEEHHGGVLAGHMLRCLLRDSGHSSPIWNPSPCLLRIPYGPLRSYKLEAWCNKGAGSPLASWRPPIPPTRGGLLCQPEALSTGSLKPEWYWQTPPWTFLWQWLSWSRAEGKGKFMLAQPPPHQITVTPRVTENLADTYMFSPLSLSLNNFVSLHLSHCFYPWLCFIFQSFFWGLCCTKLDFSFVKCWSLAPLRILFFWM